MTGRDDVTDPAGMPSPQRVRAVAAHDELHEDGESLVLMDGQVRRVSMIGTTIRALAAEGISVRELAVALEQEFGVPPEGDVLDLTRRAVADLLDAGLLADWRG